jgi:DNA-binding transcriptional LysR family regulator
MAARGLFPAALAQLRREHPQLRPRLTESEAEVALPRLGRGPLPQGVALVPVRHTLRRRIFAVWREDADRRPSIRAAVSALEKSALEVAPGP